MKKPQVVVNCLPVRSSEIAKDGAVVLTGEALSLVLGGRGSLSSNLYPVTGGSDSGPSSLYPVSGGSDPGPTN